MSKGKRGSAAGGALKRSTGLMKLSHMHLVLDRQAEIAASQAEVRNDDCPRCRAVGAMKHRPLFMVGKFTFCFGCYEQDERDMRALRLAQSGKPQE